jgi:hypothetical protein
MVDYILLSIAVSGLLVIAFFVFIFGYRARKTPILKLFGSKFFTFEFVDEAGQSEFVNRMTNDFQRIGKLVLFKYKDGKYEIREDRVFWRKGKPSCLYRLGNPIPVDVMGVNEPEIAVFDEEHKTMVKVRLSAQELRDAIESKVVHDLNKFTFSHMELIMIIVALISIVINVVVLYQIFQVNSEYSTLIKELNNLLSHIQTTPTASWIRNIVSGSF